MECDHPIQGQHLRQGDIFAANPGSANWNDPWRRFGVVLTADCDLENRKCGSTFVYAPIVGLRTYLADVWLPSQVTRLRDRAEEQFNKAVSELRGPSPTLDNLRTLSIEQFETNLLSDNKDERLRQTITIATELKRASTDLENLTNREAPVHSGGLPALLDRFFAAHEIIEKPSKPGFTYRRNLIYSTLCALAQDSRVDAYPLTDIIDLDPEMREDENFSFVVALRRFAFIPFDHILVDRIAWWNKPEHYYRVCRLRGVYKSDLMQKFTNMFIRVGIDDENKGGQKKLFERLSRKLIPEPAQ